jgi:hypothetical protein
MVKLSKSVYDEHSSREIDKAIDDKVVVNKIPDEEKAEDENDNGMTR